LEDEIQQEVCAKGYGSISSIAINAAGGWVMTLNDGKDHRKGGELPKKLCDALNEGKLEKARINVSAASCVCNPTLTHMPETLSQSPEQGRVSASFQRWRHIRLSSWRLRRPTGGLARADLLAKAKTVVLPKEATRFTLRSFLWL
jgi:hypothetical protein